jgi:oligoendopeptidase F
MELTYIISFWRHSKTLMDPSLEHRSRIVTDVLVPPRSEIEDKYTWNAPSVYESEEAWEEAFQKILDSLPDLQRFKGRLAEGPRILADALDVQEDIIKEAGKVFVYAGMSHAVEATDQDAAGRYNKVQGMVGKLQAAAAFIDPELLEIGEEKLRVWMVEEPRLAIYEHYFDDLFRKRTYVRSPEVEEILGMLADPFSGVSGSAGMLTNADFQFKPATASNGREVPLSHGTLMKIFASTDRQARRTAWHNYTDLYLEHKNSLASSLATSIKQNVFLMRVRGYDSTLEASLFEYNVPTEVFHNLIDTFRKNLPTWHRYWKIRREALGLDELHFYDGWAPLTKEQPVVLYEQAVDWICEGLAPMGEEYVSILRNGCLRDRWVDVFPNRGKRAGAFSHGAPGTYPFIMMSYGDTVFSLSTLAHELGHSMHSYLTWQTQPLVYSDYSLFVAEVASNFHQALVRAYLFDQHPDPTFQLSLIEEAMANYHRYFLIMPTLARFELEMHEAVERGEGLTADRMIERLADLFGEAYGEEMVFDRQRMGIQWARFGHLYRDYYVYQYATGISGANALANRILSGEDGAVEDYLSFLKAGSSVYPLDVLKMAGVDLTQPHAVEESFAVLSDMVDRLEGLVG